MPIGAGFDLSMTRKNDKKLKLLFSFSFTGYIQLALFGGDPENLSLISLLAGTKYYPGRRIGFSISAGATHNSYEGIIQLGLKPGIEFRPDKDKLLLQLSHLVILNSDVMISSTNLAVIFQLNKD